MSHPDLLGDPARLWQRVRDGLATAVLGRLPDPPPELHLLRVSCEVAPVALRPLLEARRLTEAVLGGARKPEKAKPARRMSLFGDTPERATEVRAGALIGPGFETRIVADLLALEPLASSACDRPRSLRNHEHRPGADRPADASAGFGAQPPSGSTDRPR